MNGTESTLGVGVAALDHDLHLARTLEAVDAVLAEAKLVPVSRTVVSADGSREAERVAREHGWHLRWLPAGSPRTLASAREAARRAAAAELVLLVDGDVEPAIGWLPRAHDKLLSTSLVAGVGGQVDEAHWSHGALVGSRRDVYGAGSGRTVSALHDVALWRNPALEAVGGFDPWLPSEDEVELGARLGQAGLSLVALGTTAGTRHGPPLGSLEDLRHRLSGGRLNGPGLVLTRARGTSLFGGHVLRYRWEIFAFLWLVAGVVTGGLARAGDYYWVWLSASAGILVALAVLRTSLSRAFWGALLAVAHGLGIARNLVLPAQPRKTGPPPRPASGSAPGAASGP